MSSFLTSFVKAPSTAQGLPLFPNGKLPPFSSADRTILQNLVNSLSLKAAGGCFKGGGSSSISPGKHASYPRSRPFPKNIIKPDVNARGTTRTAAPVRPPQRLSPQTIGSDTCPPFHLWASSKRGLHEIRSRLPTPCWLKFCFVLFFFSPYNSLHGQNWDKRRWIF